MSATATPVPLPTAASRLNLSVRSIQSISRREALGLVDAPTPASGKPYTWVTPESLDRVVASRAAVREALRKK